MNLEKKLEELNQKYRKLLREGKVNRATDIVQKARKLKNGGRPKEPEPEPKDKDSEKSEPNRGSERFEQVKGAGSELAVELNERFDSIKELAEADAKQLIPIPGIAKKKAKSLLIEANKIKEEE